MSAHDQKNTHPYQHLTPDRVLDAVESAGFATDGRLIALNSYENRVYQVGLAEGAPVVAKFYRPERWSDAQILEEHGFSRELAEAEIPVVAPIGSASGETLHNHEGFRFALFPRRGGHGPELDGPDVLLRLGTFLGRLHMVGEAHPFVHRPALDIEAFGIEPAAFLLESELMPSEFRRDYRDLIGRLLDGVRAAYAKAVGVVYRRLHGDFHPGNILWTEGGAHLVDLDDARMGPAVQDLWMLLSGDRRQMTLQLGELMAGYEEFADFDRRELHLVEALRTLRLIHYAAWLARRWDDPAFPQAFPWFGTRAYWTEHLATLREQEQRLNLPPLIA